MPNVVRIAARFGPLAAAHRLVYRLLQRLLLLDVTYLMVMDPQHKQGQGCAGDELTFRFLDGDDLCRLAREPSNRIDVKLTERLSLGRDFCFAALEHDRLASYCWLALDSIEAAHNRGARPESGVGMSYSKNVAFIYNGFSHPDFRGRGIYPRLMRHVSAAMNEKGVPYILSTADWTNYGALQGCKRAGKRKLGLIWRIGLFRWTTTFAPRLQLPHISVRIGESAEINARPC